MLFWPVCESWHLACKSVSQWAGSSVLSIRNHERDPSVGERLETATA